MPDHASCHPHGLLLVAIEAHRLMVVPTGTSGNISPDYTVANKDVVLRRVVLRRVIAADAIACMHAYCEEAGGQHAIFVGLQLAENKY